MPRSISVRMRCRCWATGLPRWSCHCWCWLAQDTVTVAGLHDTVCTLRTVVLVDGVREIHAFRHPGGVQPRNLVADLKPAFSSPRTMRCHVRAPPNAARYAPGFNTASAPRAHSVHHASNTSGALISVVSMCGSDSRNPAASSQACPLKLNPYGGSDTNASTLAAGSSGRSSTASPWYSATRSLVKAGVGSAAARGPGVMGSDMAWAPCWFGPVRHRVRRTRVPSRYEPPHPTQTPRPRSQAFAEPSTLDPTKRPSIRLCVPETPSSDSSTHDRQSTLSTDDGEWCSR